MFENSSIDFVYLDGGHTEEAVTADISAWEMKARRGGLIGGDDIDWVGLMKSVGKLCKKHDHSNFLSNGRQWLVGPLV